MKMNRFTVSRLARHFGFGLAILCAASAGAFAQGLPQEEHGFVTRFGVLTVDEVKVLQFNGRPLEPVITGNNSLSLGEPMRVGATDIVLVTDNGGTACPCLYYFVTVSKSGAKATPSFGTCGEITDVKTVGRSISVVMPGYLGPFEPAKERRAAQRQRHVFIFRDGVVKERPK